MIVGDPIDLLENSWRRRLLLALLDRDPVDPTAVDPADGSDEGAARAAVEAGRVHLPELEDRGVVEWDRETNTVSRGSNFESVRPLLELLADQRRELLATDDCRSDLRRRNERLEKFASVASHDLRNPLVSANSSLELARRDHGDVEGIADAQAAIERAFSVVDDALAFARAGRGEIDRERVRLSAVAEEAWAMVETDGATLECGDPGTVAADRDHLQRAFENLFRNSVEHGATDDGGGSDDLTVGVGTLSDGPGFYVADDGPGIASEVRDSVFEYGATTSDDGSGLGLATVQEIAVAHGWEVTATEADGGGARFEFVGPEVTVQRSVAQDG